MIIKKYFNTWILCTGFLLAAVPAWAQDSRPFLTRDNLPDAVEYLPGPPTIDSEAFKGDLFFYHQGKSLRETERGSLAKSDVSCNPHYFAKIYSEVMGITIDLKKTPKTYDLISRVIDTAMESTRTAKKKHARPRPFIEFKEDSIDPGHQSGLNPTGSFPSSHSTAGWAVALLLVELYPQAQNEILHRGYEYGESRVIAGFHYESDVAMARVVASATMARLHADDSFLKAIGEAKKEMKKLAKSSKRGKVNQGKADLMGLPADDNIVGKQGGKNREPTKSSVQSSDKGKKSNEQKFADPLDNSETMDWITTIK